MREEILKIFHDLKDHWCEIKRKGYTLPVDYCENGCSEEQFKNATKKFSPNLKKNEIVLFCDTTMGQTGKKGFIFTTTGLYSSDINFLNKIGKRPLLDMPILYKEIKKVEWNVGDNDFIITFQDNQKKYGSESANNQFIVSMLSRIIDLLEKQPNLLNKKDTTPTEYIIGESLEDAPKALVNASKKSKQVVEEVMIPLKEKESHKKETFLTKLNKIIEIQELNFHNWVTNRLSENKRKLLFNGLLGIEIVFLGMTLLMSRNPSKLFSDVYSCTMIGTITNFFIDLVNHNIHSYISYSYYWMAGLSAIILAIYELGLKELGIKRIIHFIHILLFTYMSGFLLLYLWKGIQFIYEIFSSIPFINMITGIIAILISLILLLLGIEEFLKNIKQLILSIVIGTFFMIGLVTIINIFQIQPITIHNELFYTYARITIFCGYGIVCAFKNAWDRVGQSNIHKIEKES